MQRSEMCPGAPLLDARMRQTIALVHHASGDTDRALLELDLALDGYLWAGALLDAWNVARLALLCLATANNTPARTRWARTASDLLACLTRQLAAPDAALFLLTRTGSVDAGIAAACNAATGLHSLEALHAVQEARWPVGALRGASPSKHAPGDVFAMAEAHLSLRGALPPEKFQPEALPRDTAVLVQVVLDDRVGAFLVTREGCTWIEEPSCTRASLRALVARALLAHRTRRGPWRADDASARLAQLFGLDRACVLEGVRRLVIVPDDAGLHVPYALLPLADGTPLGQRVATALMTTPRVSARPRVPRPSAVGIAAPNAPGQATLPHSLEEVRRALEHARGERQTTSSRAEALTFLPRAHTAHFACHGQFDPTDPWRAALLLHDGPLLASEIARLDLRGLDVVFLSACWQGSAATLPGREATGMPMAFLAAGAGAIVAPLWESFDLAGPALAERFHAACTMHNAVEALWLATRDTVASAPRLEGAWRVFISTLPGD